jgi:hypothetical protein
VGRALEATTRTSPIQVTGKGCCVTRVIACKATASGSGRGGRCFIRHSPNHSSCFAGHSAALLCRASSQLASKDGPAVGQAQDSATLTARPLSRVCVKLVSAPESAACGPCLAARAAVAHSSCQSISEGLNLPPGRVCGGPGNRGPSVAGSSSSSGVAVHRKVTAVGTRGRLPSTHATAWPSVRPFVGPGCGPDLTDRQDLDGPGGPGRRRMTFLQALVQ